MPFWSVPRNLGATGMVLLALTLPLSAGQATATGVQSSVGPVTITPVVSGLREPWGLDFLSDASFLVTERGGRLRLVREGKAAVVAGTPDVLAQGQGGLLDVMVPRDFAESREVWLSFAVGLGEGAATAVGRGRLSDDGARLEDFATLWQGKPMSGGRHFGSRIVEGADGTVFFTTGDRGTGPEGMEAQDPMRPEGKVIHLNRDGTPAVTLPAHAAGVFSTGHRNAQGAALDAEGTLWIVEHGAQGGDEVNRIEAGRNYGWPVISYGQNYGGGRIGTGTKRAGLEQPVHYWDPSIAPSGLLIYQGDLFPDWRGDLFTGSLNSDFISRLDPEAGYAEERIASRETGRVRDIAEAPDGSIWFLSVTDGAVYRIDPAR